jgi:alkylated DNA repair dioxygenase AlkB
MHNHTGLFAEPSYAGPPGLQFVPDFLSQAEADAVLELVAKLTLVEARYKDYTAKRRVASFGGQFDYTAMQLKNGPAIPDMFAPLIDQIAGWLGVAPSLFTHMLVAEYSPGTPLGWHRDVPDFESIVGVSLLGTATMKFRPYPHTVGQRTKVLQLELPPRSLYVIEGDARWHWQHSVAATHEQRFSVTLRTRRGSRTLLRLGSSDNVPAQSKST